MKEEVVVVGERSLEEGKQVGGGGGGGGGDKGKQLVGVKPELAEVRGVDASKARVDCIPYPKPLASYEEVVADPRLFLGTLEKLHATMRTKYMIPIIGGRELDLHRLFVEVTSRGGIEKVIRDRRWREVTAVFSFPSTATNASFVLRKYYMSLLHHYEQIYFFKSQGWNPTPTASLNSQSTTTPSSGRSVEFSSPCTESQAAASRRRKSSDISANSGSLLPPNSVVVGRIDGKCENAYMVTVTVGTTVLKGFLYHVAGQAAAPAPQNSGIGAESVGKVGRRRWRRKKLSKRDPYHPKPNRSGYNFFFADQHARLKPHYPGKDREISKIIGDLWNKLTEAEKSVYQDKGLKDKERYRNEMEDYRQKLKTGPVISDAVPIQQCSVAMEHTDSKMDIDEGNLPSIVQEDDSSSDDSDSEGEMSDTDSDLETSHEVGGAPSEPASAVADLEAEGDAFELRRREDAALQNEQAITEDVSKKVESSTDKN